MDNPRFDHDLERNVLGSILTEPSTETTRRILAKLRTEHLDHVPHQEIYRKILARHEAGQPPDYLSVRLALSDAGKLGVGPSYDIDSLDYDQLILRPFPESAEAHAETIVNLWADRRMQDYAVRLVAAAQSGQRDAWARILAEMESVRQEVTSASRKDGGLRFLSDEECEDMPPARGIVGNILFEDSTAFLYAREGRWKTFLALDWCLSCATGRKWQGHNVVAGDVVYIAAEGARGIGKRIRAWKQHHGISDTVKIHVLPFPVQLLDSGEVRDLILAIRTQVGAPVLVVIDALARSMAGGDENSTKDMNAVTDAAYAIKAAFACCVLVLHHSGKEEARGMRGSSSLRNNADTVLRITSGNENEPVIRPGEPITLRGEKTKDEATPDVGITLTTQLVTWTTNEGVTHSSLVIVAGDPAAARETVSLTDAQQKALDTLYRKPAGLKATPWEVATGRPHRTFYDTRDFLVGRAFVAYDEATKTYTVTEDGARHVSAEVRSECGRTAEGENRTADSAVADEDGISEINGARVSAVSAVPIGSSHFRTNRQMADVLPGSWTDFCPKSPTRHHKYNGKVNGLNRRVCIGCGAVENEVNA